MEKVKPSGVAPDLAFLLVLSALSLTWFKGENVINIGDFCFPMARKLYLSISTFLWDHSISMGYPAAGQLGSIFPYSLLGYFTESMGFSLVSFEKLMFFLWFAASGLGMYAFCYDAGFSRPARLFSSLFYMMNPYSLLVPWHLASGLLIAGYSMTPVLMFLLGRMLASAKLFDWAVMFLVWFIFGTYSYMNQAVAVVHLLMFGAYAAFYLFREASAGNKVVRPFILSALLFTAWLAASSYWLIPFLQGIVAQSAGASNASMGFASNQETFRLNSAPLFESLRLHGLWSMHDYWRPWTPYYAWAPAYKTSLFLGLSFVPTLLVIMGLFLAEARHRAILIFSAILFLTSLFLMKGAYPPLSEVNLWVNDSLPFFGTAFRAAFQKWGLMAAFAFSCLAGYGAGAFLGRCGRKFALGAGSFLGIALFLVYMFPFWNGQVIFSGGGIIPEARAKLPDGYLRLSEWARSKPEEFRLFSLPLSRNSNTIYKWEGAGYSGADFIRYFSEKPVIYANYGFYYDLPLFIAEKIESGKTDGLFPLFSLLNARYLLVHEDINWSAIRELNWWVNKDRKAIGAYVSKEKALVLEQDFGPLKLYRLPERYNAPHIYASGQAVVTGGGIPGLVRAASGRTDRRPPLFLLQSDLGGKSLPGRESKQSPGVVFERINPTKYHVSISGADGPFWLVFGDTYNSGWKIFHRPAVAYKNSPRAIAEYPAYGVSELPHAARPSFTDILFMFRKPLPAEHVPANSYANAWYVDPAKHKLGQRFDLEIFFMPQAAVYSGLLVAGILVAACLSVVIFRVAGSIMKRQGGQ